MGLHFFVLYCVLSVSLKKIWNLFGGANLLNPVVVVPGHPDSRGYRCGVDVRLQLGEVAEGVDFVEFAGMNDAHKQIAHTSSVEGLKKVRIFSMQYRLLQCSFTYVIV